MVLGNAGFHPLSLENMQNALHKHVDSHQKKNFIISNHLETSTGTTNPTLETHLKTKNTHTSTHILFKPIQERLISKHPKRSQTKVLPIQWDFFDHRVKDKRTPLGVPFATCVKTCFDIVGHRMIKTVRGALEGGGKAKREGLEREKTCLECLGKPPTCWVFFFVKV